MLFSKLTSTALHEKNLLYQFVCGPAICTSLETGVKRP